MKVIRDQGFSRPSGSAVAAMASHHPYERLPGRNQASLPEGLAISQTAPLLVPPPPPVQPSQPAAPQQRYENSFTAFEHDLEETPFRTADLVILRPPPPLPWRQRLMRDSKLQLRLVLALCCIVFVFWIILGALSEITARSLEPAMYSPECFLPLGGGMIGLGGAFSVLNDSRCTQQIQAYFSPRYGSYYAEVQRVAESAEAYFNQLMMVNPPTNQQLIVFDIDETALSNAVEWAYKPSWFWQPAPHQVQDCSTEGQPAPGTQSSNTGDARHRRLSSVKPMGQWLPAGGMQQSQNQVPCSTQHPWTSGDESEVRDVHQQEGGLEQRLLRVALKETTASDRPALEAVLRLYQFLYRANYSVAFVTGRSEGARGTTMANLLKAGYGQLCANTTDPRTGQQMSVRTSAPCYVQLHMRTEGDVRLASVYKPERRGVLISAGYALVGNLGDQMSDLEGLNPSQAAWKLPNPVYYIL